MSGYTKLFNSILDSTIWGESHETRLVWITLLAMADKNGEVQSSVPGLAHRARVTVPECINALQCLKNPDPFSRTLDHDGRRVEDIDGGWLLLNHGKYRRLLSAEERKEYKTRKQREYRAEKKSTLSTSGQSGHITEAEAKVEGKKHQSISAPDFPNPPPLAPTRKRSKPEDPLKWNLETGWEGISEADRAEWSAAFPACNIDTQLAAANVWLKANPAKAKKSQWRRFISNWLSRSQERGGDAPRGQISPNLAHRAEKAAKEYKQYIEPKILKIGML